MSGKDGIGFGPSFSELLVEKALSTLWASPDTSSLLKPRKQRFNTLNMLLHAADLPDIKFLGTYGSPAASSSKYLDGT